jgi:rod shape-determining protein MreC
MKKINIKKSFLIIAVIGLLIFFHFLSILSPLEKVVFSTINPLMQGLYLFSSRINTAFVKNNDQTNMVNEMAILKIRNEQLNSENAKLKSLEEENNILHQMLKFEKLTKNKLILGNVISRGDLITQKENSELIIDKGAKDGVRAGLAVVSSQGNLIGKINEVEENISKVLLITNDKCKIAASIQNNSKTIGIAEGNLGLTVNMNFIPMNEKISKGDAIISSGLEKEIPRGLLIGRISEITAESTELWQTAIIDPTSDLNNLIFVSIIIP